VGGQLIVISVIGRGSGRTIDSDECDGEREWEDN